MENNATVHAGITIPQEDILPAKNLDANRNVPKLLQADNRREHDSGVDFLSCVLLYDGAILAKKSDGAAAGTNRDCFKARI
jgi:hypothetical protein